RTSRSSTQMVVGETWTTIPSLFGVAEVEEGSSTPLGTVMIMPVEFVLWSKKTSMITKISSSEVISRSKTLFLRFLPRLRMERAFLIWPLNFEYSRKQFSEIKLSSAHQCHLYLWQKALDLCFVIRGSHP